MSIARVVAILVLLLSFAGPSAAGALDDAVAAHARGDYATALRLFRPLAEQGEPLAQSSLGFMYANGQSVPQSFNVAAEWYRKAADQGFAPAQAVLGLAYSYGKGVPKNDGEAAKWYRKAADEGFAPAQYRLGLAYGYGKGVTQSDVEAASWYRKAASQGNAEAQYHLGEMLMHGKGRGVPLNYAEAVKWYRKAADQGNGAAQTQLGVAYATGDGLPADNVLAYMWLNLASATGGFDAFAAPLARKTLEKSMTPAQIAEAQKLTREWKPRPSQIARGNDSTDIAHVVPNPSSQIEVALKMDGGVFVVPVELNGAIRLDFTIDSGASDVTVPFDVFTTLKRTGTIKDSDLLGSQTYILADGSKSKSPMFTIKSLQVGDIVLKDVTASVSPSQGMLLLGQSFLSRFKSWSIDNANHRLHLETLNN